MSFGTRETGGGRKSRIGGWAAFDRDQRRKRQGFPQNDNVVEDPFPALSTSIPKPTSNINTSASTSNGGHHTNNGSSHLYSNLWAWRGGPAQTSLQRLPLLSLSGSESDHRLIRVQDVGDMPAAVVDDHIGLLPNQSTMPFDQRIGCITMNVSDQNKNQERDHVGSGTCSTESTEEKLHSCDSDTRKAASAEIPVNAMVEGFNGVPVEPEWEDKDDDGVYLRHRKEALRTMRSASQHSKAATDAFLRGDHVSAHQHSLEARNQWLAAHALNAKAAKDILSIRNSQNDVWKLDLHGLHAAEAIQVLKQHLHTIETKLLCKRSVSPNSLKMETKIRRSNSLESFGCFEAHNLDKQQEATLRQRPTSLQVITGVGNHSRGQASLPAAVRGFLNEKGYCFEELKPGVLSVRPKFRLLT